MGSGIVEAPRPRAGSGPGPPPIAGPPGTSTIESPSERGPSPRDVPPGPPPARLLRDALGRRDGDALSRDARRALLPAAARGRASPGRVRDRARGHGAAAGVQRALRG